MKSLTILFPHQPFEPSSIDSVFEEEYKAAKLIGFPLAFYDHEALERDEVKEAFAQIPDSGGGTRTVFRGWMIPGEKYQIGHEELVRKGYHPVTTPEAYEEAHYLPLAYKHTKGECPRSGWLEGDDVNGAWNLYQGFCKKECIIKDWVKSAKSRWKDGCYIPANTTEKKFREIYEVFRNTRGKLFNRGVVLREFMPIVERGSSIAGLPVIEETRLFFWEGEILVLPSGSSPSPLEERSRWETVARRFQSNFMTVDVAYLEDGSWRVVEVGDGGVSGLPMGLEPTRFFSALWNSSLK